MKKIILWIISHNIVLFAFLIFIALIFWILKFEKKLKIQWPEAAIISFAHVAIGWSSMKLLALAEAGFDVKTAANMRVFGAIFVLPFLYYIWARKTKRNIPLVMDMSAICVIFGVISGRLNCLTQGCCQGVYIFFNEALRWPLREIELAFYVIFILCFAKKIGTHKTYGQVYPIYMISYGILRFISEFVREEYTARVGFLHLAHIWSIASIFTGSIWLYFVIRQRNQEKILRNSDVGVKRRQKGEK